jgi:chromosome partitioning protein
MKVLSIVSGKGGVGKTTSAIALAAAFGSTHRTMLVDLDPSASASRAVGLDPESLGSQATVIGLLNSSIPAVPARVPEGFRVLAGSPFADPRDKELQANIHRIRLITDIDLTIIDTPPGFGVLSRAAVSVADALLTPIELEPMATETLEQIRGMLAALGAEERWLGILPTKVGGRFALTALQQREVESGGHHVFSGIPRTITVPEARLAARSILGYSPRSVAARAYIEAAEEILKQLHTNSLMLENTNVGESV